MAAESADDLLAMLDTDDFAVTATLTGGSTAKGIFEDEYEALDFDGVVVGSTAPTFTCRTTDLPSITLGTTTATINSVAYVITESRPDGTGMSTLRLRDPS